MLCGHTAVISVNLRQERMEFAAIKKPSPPARTNEKSTVLKPADAGASLCSCGFNRQINVKLTPMHSRAPLYVVYATNNP